MQLAAKSVNINPILTSIISAYFHLGCPFPSENLSLYLQSLNYTYIIGADFNAKHEIWGCHSMNVKGRTLFNFIRNKCSKIIFDWNFDLDWNKFCNIMSTFSSLNINLKISENIDTAISTLIKNIQDTI